jgi:hypothetical protein
MGRTVILKGGMSAVLPVLMLCAVAPADAAGDRLLPRFGASAIQGFNSRMKDSAIQRFDSRRGNPMVQRFESRLLGSPVQDFNSQMLNSDIQRFDSQMMESPAQRIHGPGKPFRFFASWVYPIYIPIHLPVQPTVQEMEIPPEPASRPTAPPQIISLRCGTFTEITVLKSEILSDKEEAPCAHSEENITHRDETNDLNGGLF